MKNEGLTWAHAPGRALAKLALPITVSTLSYGVMNLVSTLFVAHLGADALAGVGLGGIVSFALVCFGIGLLRAAKTLVSQAIGAGRRDLVDAYLGAALLVGVGLGVVAALAAWALSPVIGRLCASAQAGDLAGQYLAWRTLGAPIVLAFVALRETSYGEGDAAAPMRASVAGNLTNVALDVVLILGLDLGVRGAALATLGGQAVEFALLAYPARRRLAGVRAPRHAIRAVFRQGVPTGVQFLIEVGAFLSLTAIVARMSSTDAAAHQLVLHLVNVSFLPAHALAEAASVLVGQAVGAGRDDLVRRVALRALALGAAYAAACMVVLGGFAAPIATALASDAAVANTSTALVYISLVFLVADAANVIARGVLRGAGDVRYAAVVGVVSSWATTPPLAWGLGIVGGMGVLGGWIGLAAEILVGAALFWRRVLRGGWRPAAARSRREVRAAERVREAA